jgi:uncharacterized protein (DUF1330 family)
MSAHYIGLIEVIDRDAWQQYVSAVGATIALYGGEVLFRGRMLEMKSGEHPHSLSVALRFPDVASATRWHDSPEYQAIVPIRDKGARVLLTLYES